MADHQGSDPDLRHATRVATFVGFFKNYMSVSSVAVASLPIPVTGFSLIQTYKAQTKLLSVYTPLFCFLILGFIFFSRHNIGKIILAGVYGPAGRNRVLAACSRALVSSLPLLLIFGSLSMVFLYQQMLSESVTVTRARSLAGEQGGVLASAYLHDIAAAATLQEQVSLADQFLSDRAALATVKVDDKGGIEPLGVVVAVATREALSGKGDVARVSKQTAGTITAQGTPFSPFIEYMGQIASTSQVQSSPLDCPLESIPYGMTLMLCYLGIFAFAEAAFVLMALKEYLLDLLHVSDAYLITGQDLDEKSAGRDRKVAETPETEPAFR